jgi:hypothetical protein
MAQWIILAAILLITTTAGAPDELLGVRRSLSTSSNGRLELCTERQQHDGIRLMAGYANRAMEWVRPADLLQKTISSFFPPPLIDRLSAFQVVWSYTANMRSLLYHPRQVSTGFSGITLN